MKLFFATLTSVKVYPYLQLILLSISVAIKKKQIREFLVAVIIFQIYKKDAYCYKVTSDDTEIIHIGVSLLNRDHIIIDHGSEKKEKLTGFHELTGSYYISSFFGKAKHKC